ncbi:hypothetical protein LG293_17435 (plasmid) [Citricoccus nitrophenolicus]
MRKNLISALPLLAATSLLLAGCSGAQPTEFQGMGQMKDAWEDFTGQECVTEREWADDNMSDCGDTSTLFLYDSTDDRDAAIEEDAQKAQTLGMELVYAAGPNWRILSQGFDHDGFAARHRGEVITAGTGDIQSAEPTSPAGPEWSPEPMEPSEPRTQEFADVTELVAAWEDYSGETCEGEPSSSGGAVCSDSTLFHVYEDAEAMNTHHEGLRELYPASVENQLLVGTNWSANIRDDELEALQEEIGGEIIVIKGND